MNTVSPKPISPEDGVPAVPSSRSNTTLGAKEAFPPDCLLRPLIRPAQGRLIEISGELSSGRTALAHRMTAGATARGELVGWVDLPNGLDPRSLVRAGAQLRAVLWVRPPDVPAALRSTELLIKAGFAVVVLDLEGTPAPQQARLGPPTWLRLLRAARLTRSNVVLLGAARLAGSFATLRLHTERDRARFEDGLFEGFEGRAHVLRNREDPRTQPQLFALHHRA